MLQSLFNVKIIRFGKRKYMVNILFPSLVLLFIVHEVALDECHPATTDTGHECSAAGTSRKLPLILSDTKCAASIEC